MATLIVSSPAALTIAQAHTWLIEHGHECSLRLVKRRAWHRKLPFQLDPLSGKLFIWDTDLAAATALPGPIHGVQ